MRVCGIMLVGLLCFGVHAFPQQEVTTAVDPAETRRVTGRFDAALRDVLQVLAHDSGLTIRLASDVKDDVRVKAMFESAPLDDALHLLLSTAKLTYRVVNPKTLLVVKMTVAKPSDSNGRSGERVVR